MIDFIKIYWSDKSYLEPFVCNVDNFQSLYFVCEQHTGEISYPYKTNIESMNVVVNKKSGYVKNSIHKLFNVLNEDKEHNHNDFTYSNLCTSIDYLTSRLIDTENARISQLEFGLNINTSAAAETIIRKNVLMHQFRGYNHNRKYHGSGELKQFDHSNYVIKVYDKAKQYRIEQNILRFEIKFLKSREFQKFGIYNINDLKNKENLKKLFELLIQRFDEITIVDDGASINISTEDNNKLRQYLNPSFWEEDLEGVHQQYKARHRNKFNDLLERNNLLKTKKALKVALTNKFKYLISN
ncbi:hypothetical protein [Arenibacter sp. ARW7G5Y1]|uniref:hypothetical protein n=1 Tax=Arenibacter sp. ARW7G5Y1 TaxID=2135619 RepID=UPI000D7586EB|nr:hypothetical protein [Arenibacter sp. ARW7G5Y1]PXX22854.1 hypothetical protein C7972_12233 [Arenibacter sp. ARW7G5Y1]